MDPMVVACIVIVVHLRNAAGETVTANASAVIKGKVELPCDISPPTSDDKTHLVLWFKEGSGSPIYSLDLRREVATEVSVPAAFPVDDIRSRCSFSTQSTSLAHLLVEDVRDEDEGVYRCRVDFRKAHTRNYIVSLAVIVPPKQPTILGEKGLELSSVVGPYNEGSSFFLSCEAVEGRPPPRVTWWRGNELLDESYEVTSLGIVRNDLLVHSLTRNDFNAMFTCQATNNNITHPAKTSVTVDMNLKPLEVKIVNTEAPLSSSRRYELVCQSVGSRPPPIMAWWKGERRMKRTEESMSPDANVTTSVLAFAPTAQDHGKRLACKAENPAIPGSGIQHTWKLNVHFRPIATLELGSSFTLDNIREGDDIFLECVVQANPRATKVEWKFQGNPLMTGTQVNGVITINQSLVLQHVNRTHSGMYGCVGVNAEGKGESNRINLQIKHVPVCKSGQKTFFTSARHETVTIPCEVAAYPAQVTFRWSFNRTSDPLEDGRALITTDLLRSSLMYSPKTEHDFGTFFCWATNEMGTLTNPCAFTLVASGPPDVAFNCSIVNETTSSLTVDCLPGYDGGLPQTFVCQVIDAESHQVVLTLNSALPSFYVTPLPSGTRFLLSIRATNAKGQSEAVISAGNTVPNNDRSVGGEDWLSTILAVVLGAVAVLALLGITVIIMIRLRNRRRSRRKDYVVDQTERSHIPLRRDVDESGEAGESEKSPDVIPCGTEQEFPSVKVKCLQPKWAYSKEGPCDNCRHHANSYGVCDNKYQMRKIMPYEEMSPQEVLLHLGHRGRCASPRWMSPEISDPPHPHRHGNHDHSNRSGNEGSANRRY